MLGVIATTVAASWSSSVGTLLFGVESMSAWSAAETCAVLVNVPAAVALATIVNVADAPVLSAPTVQTPVALS